MLEEDRVAADAAWDELHAIVTNDRSSSASQLLAQYRRLWVIEESFRALKHGLAVRPIDRFKPEHIQAQVGLCYLAFTLTRHAQQLYSRGRAHLQGLRPGPRAVPQHRSGLNASRAHSTPDTTSA